MFWIGVFLGFGDTEGLIGFGFFGFCSVFWMSGSCVSVDPKASLGSVRAESTQVGARESIFWTNYTITRDPVLVQIQ